MAEEQPSLHIDTDWKRQAQEEKRKLAEQEAAKKAQQTAPPPGIGAGASAGAGAVGAPPMGGGAAPPEGSTSTAGGVSSRPAAGRGAGAGAQGRERQMPVASFSTLVQGIVTQVLFYLGDLTPRGVEPQVNLDMAKYNIDLLGILEEKTKSNLAEDEQRLLDSALYEARMRYVAVASQYATV
jgi:hypothetical protein